MSTSVFQAAKDLNCPNCGAPCTMPTAGNQVQCNYCGTRFLLPEAQRVAAPVDMAETSTPFTTPVISVETQANIGRWVKWFIIFILVTTLVPVICSVVAGICAAFGGILPVLLR